VLNAIWYEITDPTGGEPESHPQRPEPPRAAPQRGP